MAHSLFSGSTHTQVQAQSRNVNSLGGKWEEKNVQTMPNLYKDGRQTENYTLKTQNRGSNNA